MRQRLLRITTSYFVAGVVYEKRTPVWVPIRAAPILAWVLSHESHKELEVFLKGPGKRKGWEWEWL